MAELKNGRFPPTHVCVFSHRVFNTCWSFLFFIALILILKVEKYLNSIHLR